MITRSEVYRSTPKHQARCRISELEVRRAGWKPLTPAELSELDDLRARFPAVASDLAGVDWTAKVILPLEAILQMRRLKQQGLGEGEIRKAIIEDLRVATGPH